MPERENENGICLLVISVERDIARVTKRHDQFTEPWLIIERPPDSRLSRQHLKLMNNCLRGATTRSGTFLHKELAATL
jgi:hypothetical protein